MDLLRAIVKSRFELPAEHFASSAAAGAIITALLTKDNAKRLGSLASGEGGVANHPWFSESCAGVGDSTIINFDELRQKRIKAPRIPTIKDPLDNSNFEDWNHLKDKTKMKFPQLSPTRLNVFDDF